jgi:hypothetical protein
MASDKKNRKLDGDLVAAVDETRRDLIKKLLLGGTAVYVAPVIASFSLTGSSVMANDGLGVGSNMARMDQPYGSNMARMGHPFGSNQRA